MTHTKIFQKTSKCLFCPTTIQKLLYHGVAAINAYRQALKQMRFENKDDFGFDAIIGSSLLKALGALIDYTTCEITFKSDPRQHHFS